MPWNENGLAETSALFIAAIPLLFGAFLPICYGCCLVHLVKRNRMASINPYINFSGNALEAFTLYKSVFGGQFINVTRFKDLASSDFQVLEKEANKIMHIALPIGHNVLMGNDVPEVLARSNERENRGKIAIGAEGWEEADKPFNKAVRGGEIEVPLSKSLWGSYFGMLRDK